MFSPAAGGVDLGLYLHTVLKSSNQAFREGTGVKEGDARATILIGPALATNLLSTSLIGFRAVQLSQQEKRCHQGRKGPCYVGRVRLEQTAL
jgi:hypothetical protein